MEYEIEYRSLIRKWQSGSISTDELEKWMEIINNKLGYVKYTLIGCKSGI